MGHLSTSPPLSKCPDAAPRTQPAGLATTSRTFPDAPTLRKLDTAMANTMARASDERWHPTLKPQPIRGEEVNLVGALPFADIATIGKLLDMLGLHIGAHLPSHIDSDVRRARSGSAVLVVRPSYPRTTVCLQSAGQKVIDSGPLGAEGTHDWIERVGAALGIRRSRISATQNAMVARIWERLSRAPLEARILIAGTTGVELQIARLLVECGAEIPLVSTSLESPDWPSADAAWLEMNGTQVVFRVGARAARQYVDAFRPHLVVGCTSVCARARMLGIPSLNTTLLAACPMMGSTGAGPLSAMVRRRLSGTQTAPKLHPIN